MFGLHVQYHYVSCVIELTWNLDENILLYKHHELHDIEKDHHHHYRCFDHQRYPLVMQENRYQKHMYVYKMDYIDLLILERRRGKED